jgi:hypothetical protein
MTLMAKVHQQRYPQAFSFLQQDLPTLKLPPQNALWNAFLANAHLDAAEADAAVQMGSTPPLLFASALGESVWGQFNPEVPGRIEIGIEVFEQFERSAGDGKAQTFLRAKVLHEMCHWGCFRKKVPDDDVAGEAFERAVFGGPLQPWWTTGAPPQPAFAPTLFTDARDRARALVDTLAGNTLLPGRQHDPRQEVFGGIDVAEGMPRGYRNNNPGNIRVGDAWRGLADPALHTAFQQREASFCVFREPEWGLRAMAYLLRRYQRDHGLDTPRKIIARWAPASDNNNVAAYASQVAGALAIGPDDFVDATLSSSLVTMVRAMARHENGDVPPYADVQYQAALLLLD